MHLQMLLHKVAKICSRVIFTPSRPACPWSARASPFLHRSHFGSRYQSGRCALRSPPFAPRGFESHCEHFFPILVILCKAANAFALRERYDACIRKKNRGSRPACSWSVCASSYLHRSHFGSRYQSGRCALRSPPFAPRGFESYCDHFSVLDVFVNFAPANIRYFMNYCI